jgi:hypothetical protein
MKNSHSDQREYIEHTEVFSGSNETIPLYMTPTKAPLSIKADKTMKKEVINTIFLGGTMIAKRRAQDTAPHVNTQKLITNIHHLQRLFLSHSATSEAQMA